MLYIPQKLENMHFMNQHHYHHINQHIYAITKNPDFKHSDNFVNWFV